MLGCYVNKGGVMVNLLSSCEELGMEAIGKTNVVSSEAPSDDIHVAHMSNRQHTWEEE